MDKNNISEGWGLKISEYFLWPLLVQIFVVWVLPLGTPIAVGGMLYLKEQPLGYVFLGAIFTFAAISHGLLSFDEWRSRRRVENKLVFSQVRVGINAEKTGVGLGVQFQNIAQFPIEFHVIEFRTRIKNMVPENKVQVFSPFLIPESSVGWWDDALIQLPSPIVGTFDGEVEFSIKYGRKGNSKYKIKDKKKVYLTFDTDGQLKGCTWQNLT